jgi:hypothetical protein
MPESTKTIGKAYESLEDAPAADVLRSRQGPAAGMAGFIALSRENPS